MNTFTQVAILSGLAMVIYLLNRMEKRVMSELQNLKDAIAEAKTAREAADLKSDAALKLLGEVDKKLDELLEAGNGATDADLRELTAQVKEGTAAIVAQGDEAQAAVDAANAPRTPPQNPGEPAQNFVGGGVKPGDTTTDNGTPVPGATSKSDT